MLESVELTNPHHPERVAPSRLRRLTPRSAGSRLRYFVSVDRVRRPSDDERIVHRRKSRWAQIGPKCGTP